MPPAWGMPPNLWFPEKPAIIRSIPAVKLGMLPGMFPAVALPKVRVQPTLTYLGQTVTNGTTSATQPIGSVTVPSAGLLIVVGAIYGDTSRTVTQFKLGGLAKTLVVAGPSAGYKMAIGSAVVSAGTYTDGQFILSAYNAATFYAFFAGFWLLNGYVQEAAHATSAAAAFQSGNLSVSLNVPAYGIAVAGLGGGASMDSVAWTSFTERYEGTTPGGIRGSFADLSSLAAITPLSVTPAAPGGNTARGIVAASWS
jgi:hypothetical protein